MILLSHILHPSRSNNLIIDQSLNVMISIQFYSSSQYLCMYLDAVVDFVRYIDGILHLIYDILWYFAFFRLSSNLYIIDYFNIFNFNEVNKNLFRINDWFYQFCNLVFKIVSILQLSTKFFNIFRILVFGDYNNTRKITFVIELAPTKTFSNNFQSHWYKYWSPSFVIWLPSNH